ncbi:Uncharacterized protein HSRCO_0324 [Halanaeroarchaeum sp. HSR-CO]|uniref:hypothetical protein n=1 Tax=Halanaeroarchaeum sp. HSR-CO TaxID=2866382 RepID=UPI00217D38F4|nr:hypothetical protein [Halanaeroarchaeum sp. HSR-CO]UWG46623.1 Uncharacterized protein HSRCO_0324 [Halanaeroarchaeum sp. HSR-CO]
MDSAACYEYELEYAVPGTSRSAYEDWLTRATVSWGMDARVRSLSHQETDTRFTPYERLVFEFESVHEWAGFVESQTHTENVSELRELATEIRTRLWRPRRAGRLTRSTAAVTAAAEDR